jgi:hypothetical protein
MLTSRVAFVAALAAAILVAIGTAPPGPALYGDSAGYLGAAASIAHHGTLRVPDAPYTSADSTAPLAQWPPGYPALLAVPMHWGASDAASARIVNVISAAVTVLLVALLLGDAAGPGWGALGAVAVIVTTSVVWIHLEVLSEPPFTALTMLTLALMVTAPDRTVAAGMAAAVCVLVRYAGLGVVGGVGVWVALQPGSAAVRSSVAVRVRRAATGMAPGVVVYVAWSAIVRHAGAAVRQVHLDHHVLAAARMAVSSTFTWLGPGYLGEPHGVVIARVVLKLVTLVALAALVVTLARRPPRTTPATPATTLAAAASVLALSLVALMFVARLLESGVTFYDRVLAPVHALLDVAIVAALAAWWPTASRATRLIATGIVAAWITWSTAISIRLAHEIITRGVDHTVVGRAPSPLWTWVRDSGRTAPIYTNDPADVYFETHRPSRFLPWVMTSDSARALCEALAVRPGIIVWAAGYTGEGLVYPELVPRLTTPATLVRAVPLRQVAQFPDGVVWVSDSSLAGDSRCVAH